MSQINKNARQIIAPILSNKRVGQYHQIIISVGEIAAQCKPGNFVAISVGGDSSRMVLRRAFAISRVSTSSTVGGTMELIVAPHGQGSKWLCAQNEGDVLDLVAPLGTAFGIPTEPVPVLLIGGGYGSAPLFVDTVFRLHGMPIELVPDRDPRFTAKFWQCVFRQLGTQLSMSTSDHPQTDGQTERVYRVLEEILRSFVHSFQSWREFLPLAEFAINNSVHASTGHTPFFVNGLRHPRLPPLLGAHPKLSGGGLL
jgi:hypothetical protein